VLTNFEWTGPARDRIIARSRFACGPLLDTEIYCWKHSNISTRSRLAWRSLWETGYHNGQATECNRDGRFLAQKAIRVKLVRNNMDQMEETKNVHSAYLACR
jgi:hypothetical protein